MSECRWVQDGVGEAEWDTDCRHRFTINEGTPSENHMAFCCYCGKPVREIVDTDEEGSHDRPACIGEGYD